MHLPRQIKGFETKIGTTRQDVDSICLDLL